MSDEELKFVQFYIDSPVTLEYIECRIRCKCNSRKQDKEFQFNIRKRIIIDRETPGIAVYVKTNSEVKIKFDEDLVLTFHPKNSESRSEFLLSEFNNEPINNNDKIYFRDSKYTIKYGKYNIWGKGPKFNFRKYHLYFIDLPLT